LSEIASAVLSVSRTRPWWHWLGLALVVIVLDQLTKQIVLARFTDGENLPITSFFSLVLVYNYGAAWSIGSGAGGRWIFSAIAIVASGFMIYLLRKHSNERWFAFGVALILGGALGNLWDRIQLGKVVDFLLVHNYLPSRAGPLALLDPFPAFNVADAAITCGAILLIIDSVRHRDPAKES
jgi:signal peptidase II